MSFQANIKELALDNENFRKVIHTGENSQLVLMSLKPGEEIGEETHDGVDQILFFVDGDGKAVIDGHTESITIDDVVFVPAGTLHNFINTGDSDMKLYTVYSPPEHPDGTIHATKEDAMQE